MPFIFGVFIPGAFDTYWMGDLRTQFEELGKLREEHADALIFDEAIGKLYDFLCYESSKWDITDIMDAGPREINSDISGREYHIVQDRKIISLSIFKDAKYRTYENRKGLTCQISFGAINDKGNGQSRAQRFADTTRRFIGELDFGELKKSVRREIEKNPQLYSEKIREFFGWVIK